MPEEEKNLLEELLDEIRAAIKETVSLKITTIVGDVKQDKKGSNPTVESSKTMHTEIDLIQGDITTMVDQAFLTGELSEIREHHLKREDQSYDIIHKNIAALKELAEFVKELLVNSQGPGE